MGSETMNNLEKQKYLQQSPGEVNLAKDLPTSVNVTS